jgi:hypothetical protein
MFDSGLRCLVLWLRSWSERRGKVKEFEVSLSVEPGVVSLES